MSVLKIELLGSEVLRRRAEEVREIDEKLRLLIQDMFETMYEAEGIGLAGPQVGISKRVCIVDLNDGETPKLALVNPRIVESSKATEKGEEGCLSIPGVAGLVARPPEIVVVALDPEGHAVRVEADGLMARCLQHEIDHLDGVLFIDRLSPLKRDMLLKKYKASLSDQQSGTTAAGGRGR
ncbi:peptide deformylase [soil metagenome]